MMPLAALKVQDINIRYVRVCFLRKHTVNRNIGFSKKGERFRLNANEYKYRDKSRIIFYFVFLCCYYTLTVKNNQ